MSFTVVIMMINNFLEIYLFSNQKSIKYTNDITDNSNTICIKLNALLAITAVGCNDD
jgi:hypothetical protein